MQTIVDAPVKIQQEKKMRQAVAKVAGKTTADLLRVSADSSHRYELIQGKIITMSPASYKHGVFAMRLGGRMLLHAEDNDLGFVFAAETGFQLTTKPDTVRAPDVAFVGKERIPSSSGFSYFPGAPDLAVEVVSPGDRADEVQDKVQTWLHHGTKLVWVVEPKTQTVTIFRLDGSAAVVKVDGVLDGEDVLPGFRYALAKLFAE